MSATNSEVESAMNHMRRRTILRDTCFSRGASDAFNSGDAYLRAAQNGLARAMEQYVKDIRENAIPTTISNMESRTVKENAVIKA